jgi:transposase
VQLLRLMRRQMNSHVHRRMNVVLLLDDGWTAERIAEALFIDAETVHERRRRYETSGVAGLERLSYQGSEPALSVPQREALKAELEAHLYMTAKAVCGFVQRRFAVTYTPNAMTKLLKRLGFVYKKPICVPAKADAAAQEKFATEALLPLMAQAGPDHSLYFVDGMHPAYAGHPACGWIRRLPPLGGDEGVFGAGWMPHPPGVFAGLFAQPQPDRAAVVVPQKDHAVE